MNYLGCPHAVLLDLDPPDDAAPASEIDEEEQ
jgi:hypothetical protein